MRGKLACLFIPSGIFAYSLYRPEKNNDHESKFPSSKGNGPTTINIAVGSIVLLMVGWRLASRRRSLPCPSWMSGAVEIDNPFVRNIHGATQIIKHAGIKPGNTVLDAGSGPGRVTIPVAEMTGEDGSVVAMDIQADMLKKVEAKAQEKKLKNIKYLNAGLGDNKLLPQKYDYALLIAVLGEIPHQEHALMELHKALKTTGILSVTEIIFDPHFQSRTALLRATEKAGFKEKNRFGHWYAYTLNFQKKNNTTPKNPAEAQKNKL